MGEEWIAEDMEEVEGGARGDAVDSDIVITDLEDGSTAWDKSAWGIWVGLVRIRREYGAILGSSKKAFSGQAPEARGVGEWGKGVLAITQSGT